MERLSGKSVNTSKVSALEQTSALAKQPSQGTERLSWDRTSQATNQQQATVLVLTVRPTRQHCGPATCGEAPHGQQTPHALAHQSWRVPSLCAPALDECVRVCMCSTEQVRFARRLGQHGTALTNGASVDIKAERTDFICIAGLAAIPGLLHKLLTRVACGLAVVTS